MKANAISVTTAKGGPQGSSGVREENGKLVINCSC